MGSLRRTRVGRGEVKAESRKQKMETPEIGLGGRAEKKD